MRHGLMVRTLAAALLSLVAGTAARAGGKDCPNCFPTSPLVVKGVGTPCNDCGGPRVKKGFGTMLNGTGCCDAGFIFNPSRSFFAPCATGCSDLPISVRGGRQTCGTPIYGPGIGKPANTCTGPTSFLNR